MKKLNKYQKQALGISQINNNDNNNQISLLQSLAPLFKPIDKYNKQMGDQGQTYHQFMQMKGIQPNQNGTGRVDFTDINKIQYFFLNKLKKPKKIAKKIEIQIKQFLESYLNIRTSLVNFSLYLTQELKIIDRTQDIQYSPQTKKISHSKSSINAMQLLDLLTEYKQPSKILICFIDAELYQPNDQQSNQSIYGRACGDGVAVITLMTKNQEQRGIMIETTIHQVLHTLGFDHCLAWTCLMNPCVEGQFWLCPACIRKILTQNKKSVLQWLKGVQQIVNKANLKCSKQGVKLIQKVQSTLESQKHLNNQKK